MVSKQAILATSASLLVAFFHFSSRFRDSGKSSPPHAAMLAPALHHLLCDCLLPSLT